MDETILLIISIASLVLMVFVGSLPRAQQSFSNDPTSEIKKAGYWKTRTIVKIGALLASLTLMGLLLFLMMQNY